MFACAKPLLLLVLRGGWHHYWVTIVTLGGRETKLIYILGLLASGPPPAAPCLPFGFEEAFKEEHFSKKWIDRHRDLLCAL